VTEAHLVEMVLKLLMDEISEVKNSAVSWWVAFTNDEAEVVLWKCCFKLIVISSIAAMARKSRPPQMYSIVSALLNGIASGEEERTNISCLGELNNLAVFADFERW